MDGGKKITKVYKIKFRMVEFKEKESFQKIILSIKEKY